MKFSLAKNRVGAYFNDGRTIVWYQAPPLARGETAEDCKDQAMILAVRAACKKFDEVYWRERSKLKSKK